MAGHGNGIRQLPTWFVGKKSELAGKLASRDLRQGLRQRKEHGPRTWPPWFCSASTGVGEAISGPALLLVVRGR